MPEKDAIDLVPITTDEGKRVFVPASEAGRYNQQKQQEPMPTYEPRSQSEEPRYVELPDWEVNLYNQVNDLIGDVVTSAGSFISDALFNKPPSRLGTVGDVMNRGLESVNEYIIEEFIPTFGLETWEDIAGFAARQVGQFGGTFSGNLSTQLTKTEDLLDEAGNIVREGIGLGRDDDDERPLTVRTKSGPAPITGIEGPQPLAVVEPIPFEVFSGGSFPAGGSGRQDCVPESEFRSSFERLDDESDDDYLLRLESEVRRLKKEGKIC